MAIWTKKIISVKRRVTYGVIVAIVMAATFIPKEMARREFKRASFRNTRIEALAKDLFSARNMRRVDFKAEVKRAVADRNMGVRFIRRLSMIDRRVRKNLLRFSQHAYDAQVPLVKIRLRLMNGEGVPAEEMMEALKNYRRQMAAAAEDLEDAAEGLPKDALSDSLEGMAQGVKQAAERSARSVAGELGSRGNMKPEVVLEKIDELLAEEAKVDSPGFLKGGASRVYKYTIGALVRLFKR